MVKLIARSSCQDLLPVTFGACKLSEVLPVSITSVAPLKGQEKRVSQDLKSMAGMGFPSPNRTTGKEGARCIWAGQGQAFLLGPAPGVIRGAAISDQSDAWAVMRLQGVDAEQVLARLVPVNLTAGSFRRGHTVRTMINHMSASITRTGVDTFDIMVFRSMAATAVHELAEAMKSLAARQ